MTKYHLMTSQFDENLPSAISQEIEDGHKNRLVTYDLYNSLQDLELEIKLNHEILDVHLLESIIYLGKYHRRYFRSKQDIPIYGLRKYILEASSARPSGSTGLSSIPLDFWSMLKKYALKLKNRAVAEGVWDHYRKIEIPFAMNLYRLARYGITLDLARVERINRGIYRARQKLEYALDVNNVSGTKIKDLNDWISGYGFNEFFPAGREEISMKELSLLEDQHQVFQIFLRLVKLKRIENLLQSMASQQKIKPFYSTMGAVTGRCTSKNPNIMGVPKIFRPVVIPSKADFGIVECDYTQMEVGVAAALSNDQNLINDFNTSDVYEKAAGMLFGTSGDGSRSKAKIIFLGIQYGLSQRTIGNRLEISQEETSRILSNLFARYSSLSIYLRELEKLGQNKGYVESISGLRRYRRYPGKIPDYWEMNWFKNFPIQSSAASVFKRAIIRMCQELKHESFHLLVPLYDSVVFECPLDRLQEITKAVMDCMITSMREYFPKLEPKIRVNDLDPSCWNSRGDSKSIDKFLDNPLYDIDIRGKASSNVDWSQYF